VRKRRFALSVAAFFSAVLVWTAQAQNSQLLLPLKVEKVQNDLYVISGDGNVTAVLTYADQMTTVRPTLQARVPDAPPTADDSRLRHGSGASPYNRSSR
jgi:hypothetical protein